MGWDAPFSLGESGGDREQEAFLRTHKARERARQARVKAAKAAKAKKVTVKVRGQKKK
jgi:hypothetical protein